MTGPSSSLPSPPRPYVRSIVSAAVACIAFVLYRSTLLPGIDFGDTASFQARAGELALSPRDAYPLYYAIGNIIWWLVGGEAAHGLNLASAICGALACGVLAWVASGLTGSLVAGAVGGLLLATSYTFWTQAIIAEVYALHLLLMGLVLAALVWWDRRRSLGRLALVFALYALSFGNHLMTVLLAPAIVFFVASAPGGARLLFSPRTIAVALLLAAAGASQYLWNASYLWSLPDPPASLGAFLYTFWFDVTKSDWRETMAFAVHQSALTRRTAMYVFDLRQQFGDVGIALALAGLVWLVRRPRLLVLIVSAWLVAFVFAYAYNVGDTHVFYLPSHQIVAIAAACGAAGILSLTTRLSKIVGRAALPLVASALVAYPAWRAWDTWPAVDRHEDRRPIAWLSSVAADLDQRAILLADVNWQLEKGFDYYQRLHPELNLTRALDTMLTLPFLVRDNIADGRAVFATPLARDLAHAAYGDLFTFDPDPTVDTRPLAARLSALPPGTPYVLAVLAPYPDLVFDRAELAEASRLLTGGTAILGQEPSYTVVAGLIGETPTFDRRQDLPWRARAQAGPLALDIRMESWLAADTIRRAGFGQVVAGRRHVLILERGVSFVALGPAGEPLVTTYASSVFAPLPRYRVRFSSGVPAGEPR